jgi:histidine ammonia-lyase
MLTATQAIEFKKPLKSSEVLDELFLEFRREISFISEDEYSSALMHSAKKFVRTKMKKYVRN